MTTDHRQPTTTSGLSYGKQNGGQLTSDRIHSSQNGHTWTVDRGQHSVF